MRQLDDVFTTGIPLRYPIGMLGGLVPIVPTPEVYGMESYGVDWGLWLALKPSKLL